MRIRPLILLAAMAVAGGCTDTTAATTGDAGATPGGHSSSALDDTSESGDAPQSAGGGSGDAVDDANDPRPNPCAVPTATNVSTEANVVELNLEAAPLNWDPGTGVPIEAYAYNGMIPGPLIKAKVGDTLRVHFTNNLPEETTIHWHGLRVPSHMDGIVHDGAKPIPAGGTFDYEFELKDTGFFWYHPHLNTAAQIEKGLYAPLLVEPATPMGASCELPLVLDDILLRNSGALVPATDTMGDGRLGNRLLTNGTTAPVVTLRPGTQAILHLVNAANARYFDVALRDGATPTTMIVVATDGGPVSPQVVEHLVLGPGDRYSVYVDTGLAKSGSLVLETRPFELHEAGWMMAGPMDPFEDMTEPMLTIALEGNPVTEPALQFPDLQPEVVDAPSAVAHAWVIRDVMDHSAGNMTMTGSIDGETWPNVPLVTFERDTPVRLTITNKGYMHHPFHIHGQRFQVVDVDGLPPAVVGWEDTIDLPPKSSMTLLSRMDNPGLWMYHCHILEHAESGMMAELRVQ